MSKKKTTTKESVPTDDDFMDDLDLGLDEDEVVDEANKGLKSGVNIGLKQGIKEGISPIAKEAGKKAIEQIVKGPADSSFDNTINQIKQLNQANLLQAYTEKLKREATSPTITQPPQQQSPVQEIVTMMQLFKELNETLGGKKEDGGNANAQIIAQMVANVMQNRNQQQYYPPPQQNSNNELIIALIQQNAQLQAQMFKTQQEMTQQQQQMLMQQIQQLQMSSQQPSFVEQFQSFQQQMQQMKEAGLIGSGNHAPSERELQLQFEAKKMVMELEKEKLLMEQKLQLEQMKSKQDKEQMNLWNQTLMTIQNMVKNLKDEFPPLNQIQQPQPQQFEQKTTPPQPQQPLTTRLSERVRSLLRVPDYDPTNQNQDEGDDDNE